MKLVATSPSFSRHPALVSALNHLPVEVKLNTEGIRLEGEALIGFVGDAAIWIVGLESVDAAILAACENLKFIAKYGVGLNNVDEKACQHYHVELAWQGGVNRRSVAELTLCYMLGLCRNVFQSSTLLRGGAWRKNGGFQLSEKVIGIVGCGHIGKELVSLLQPFGCRILVHDILDQTEYYQQHNIEAVSFEALLREADIVSLHVPLTADTQYLVDAVALSQMKSSAFLINTARGGIVEEAALKEALLSQKIAGAALDVFEVEPLVDQVLHELPNVICTPHIGGNAREAVEAMGMSAIEQVKRFLDRG